MISISSFNMKIKRIHLLYHKWGNCGQEQSLIWSAAWKISFLHYTFPPLLSYKSSCLMGLQSLTRFDRVLQRHFPITRPKCSCRTSHRNQSRDVSGLAPCTHEEEDTRILLHMDDAVKQGYNKVSIRTVDTDVVVLAVASAQPLNITELWIAFGAGNNFQYLPAHEMADALGPDCCVALPMFHAFNGCDTVSCFGGRGKRTTWGMWNAYEEITPAFCALAATPVTIENWLSPLERFVVLLYDRTSSQEFLNGARKQLFTQKGRAIDGLPPTQAVFLQHTKRAAYQAGRCWVQTMIATPELPSPSEWGWKIYWTTLPEATQACRELLRCGCKKGCMGLCKCLKAGLQCTALCYCGGLCARS